MGRTSNRLKRQQHFTNNIEPVIKVVAITGLIVAILIIVLDHFGVFG